MALADVQAIIAAAQAAATSALNDAKSYSALAQSAAATIVYPGSAGTITWTKPILSGAVLSATDLGSAFDTAAANNFANLGPDYISKFNAFIATYFPNVNGCLATNSDNWICNTIINGATGIPAAIENAIWQRAREAILKEGRAQRDEAYTDFASRGFSMPAGQLNYRLLQIDQKNIDKSAEIARETAIKAIEVQIETIKFAVQQAIAVRLGAAQAAASYVKGYIQTYDSATERAKAMASLRFQFWNAYNDYWRAFAAIEALDVQVRSSNVQNTYRDNDLFVKAANDGTTNRTHAALAAAQALGAAAAAALGGQNSLAYTGQVGET